MAPGTIDDRWLPGDVLARRRSTEGPAPDKGRNESLLQLLAEAQKALDESDNKPFYYFRTLRHVAEVQAKLEDREAAKATLRRAAGLAAAAKQAVANDSYGLSSAYQLREVGHAQAEVGDKEGAGRR